MLKASPALRNVGRDHYQSACETATKHLAAQAADNAKAEKEHKYVSVTRTCAYEFGVGVRVLVCVLVCVRA